jgi:hypothetical protein
MAARTVPLAPMVLDDMKEYLEKPRAAVCARLEAMKRLPRLQVRFLHQVFGFGAVTDDSRGCAKQRIEMRHRSRLEITRLIATAKNHGSPLVTQTDSGALKVECAFLASLFQKKAPI